MWAIAGAILIVLALVGGMFAGLFIFLASMDDDIPEGKGCGLIIMGTALGMAIWIIFYKG